MASELVVVGLSHHTAPVEVRERLAAPASAEQLGEVVERVRLTEAALLSTCNRVELIAAAADVNEAVPHVHEYFARRSPFAELEQHTYCYQGRDAVRHLFRVASGLDSMVLGEPQILGQVKEARQCARRAGTLGTVLGRCFDHAFAVAKRVRAETALASGHISVSSIATELAGQIFADLASRKALLLGAGEMAEAAARSLANQGASLVVLNRSKERADRLAQTVRGTARPLSELTSELHDADVVLSSTAHAGFVITHELMTEVARIRRFRPLFLIDIAVPRDIEPRVGLLQNVFLYDIDDLKSVSEQNLQARKGEVQAAEDIVEAEVQRYELWRHSLELTPTIVALRERFRSVLSAEIERTALKLSSLNDTDRESLYRMADTLTKKLLHHAITRLKHSTQRNEEAALIEAARTLFDLPLPEHASGTRASERRKASDPAEAYHETAPILKAVGRDGET
ncbi:MAG: glutamyl-tRNA reductase [Proteobacteria bacterium]|nr:glutamyl-tRNA reductase [Pseudomonadota bacterium]